MKKIYGVSYKNEMYNFDTYVKEFDSIEEFENWMDTEQYDFRTREEISRLEFYELKKWLEKSWS